MTQNEIEHFLDGLVYLDTINLEEKLNESLEKLEKKKLKLSYSHDLFEKAKIMNVFFDLSKCKFAELGALAHLILTIESYIKNHY